MCVPRISLAPYQLGVAWRSACHASAQPGPALACTRKTGREQGPDHARPRGKQCPPPLASQGKTGIEGPLAPSWLQMEKKKVAQREPLCASGSRTCFSEPLRGFRRSGGVVGLVRSSNLTDLPGKRADSLIPCDNGAQPPGYCSAISPLSLVSGKKAWKPETRAGRPNRTGGSGREAGPCLCSHAKRDDPNRPQAQSRTRERRRQHCERRVAGPKLASQRMLALPLPGLFYIVRGPRRLAGVLCGCCPETINTSGGDIQQKLCTGNLGARRHLSTGKPRDTNKLYRRAEHETKGGEV